MACLMAAADIIATAGEADAAQGRSLVDMMQTLAPELAVAASESIRARERTS